MLLFKKSNWGQSEVKGQMKVDHLNKITHFEEYKNWLFTALQHLFYQILCKNACMVLVGPRGSLNACIYHAQYLTEQVCMSY